MILKSKIKNNDDKKNNKLPVTKKRNLFLKLASIKNNKVLDIRYYLKRGDNNKLIKDDGIILSKKYFLQLIKIFVNKNKEINNWLGIKNSSELSYNRKIIKSWHHRGKSI